MKIEELDKCSRDIAIQRYYWYTGEILTGRIVRILNHNAGTSYFFATPEQYSPEKPAHFNYDYLKANCKLIVSTGDRSQYEGNADLIEFFYFDHFELLGYSKPQYLHTHSFDKLIIIGAGASADFDHNFTDTANRPFPLSNDLFKKDLISKMIEYPGVRALKPTLSRCDNLEAELQKEWELLRDQFDFQRLSELINIQFYLHDLFLTNSLLAANHFDNNYTPLVKSIYDYSRRNPQKKILIISYNYDTLLDRALERKFGFDYRNIDDYTDATERPFVLLKPHGSANWVKKLMTREEFIDEGFKVGPSWPTWNPLLESKRGQEKSSITALSFNLSKLAEHLFTERTSFGKILNCIQTNISILPFSNKLKNDIGIYMNERAYFPQLLIPFKDKDEFVMPRSHVALLKDILPQIKDILIIGWKGAEDKMKQLLLEFCDKDSMKKLHVVDYRLNSKEDLISNLNDNLDAIKNLKDHLRYVVSEVHLKGFSEYTEKLINRRESFFQDSVESTELHPIYN